jgi:hypothetical protein
MCPHTATQTAMYATQTAMYVSSYSYSYWYIFVRIPTNCRRHGSRGVSLQTGYYNCHTSIFADRLQLPYCCYICVLSRCYICVLTAGGTAVRESLRIGYNCHTDLYTCVSDTTTQTATYIYRHQYAHTDNLQAAREYGSICGSATTAILLLYMCPLTMPYMCPVTLLYMCPHCRRHGSTGVSADRLQLPRMRRGV